MIFRYFYIYNKCFDGWSIIKRKLKKCFRQIVIKLIDFDKVYYIVDLDVINLDEEKKKLGEKIIESLILWWILFIGERGRYK